MKNKIKSVLRTVKSKFKKQPSIKDMDLVTRQQGFLNEYRVLSAKWGVDLQPAYQVLDVFAMNKAKEEAQTSNA